jgi:cbb3-type cytochrome oxidase subunit 3
MSGFQAAVQWLQLHSVIFMIAVFALIVISAYWPSRRATIQSHAAIPLRDDQ